MKKAMSYEEQIRLAKQVVGSWTAEKKSWMRAQGTNEYLEKKALDRDPRNFQTSVNKK